MDILIVRRQSANSLTFKDFNVHRTKITRALYWLKTNNRYYADIVIDVNPLPENGPVDNLLPQLGDAEDEFFDDNDNEVEDTIVFVPTRLHLFRPQMKKMRACKSLLYLHGL